MRNAIVRLRIYQRPAGIWVEKMVVLMAAVVSAGHYRLLDRILDFADALDYRRDLPHGRCTVRSLSAPGDFRKSNRPNGARSSRRHASISHTRGA